TILSMLIFCFFFSSRRRHTRFSRDWSSDVCSSDLPLCPQGTAFQKKVWEQLSYIEYGHTTTYKAIATRMQQPTGMRAVGAANGRSEERRVGKEDRSAGWRLGLRGNKTD